MAQASAEAFEKIAGERELATKLDIETVKNELQHQFQKELAETKHEILKWVSGMIIAQSTLLLAALGIGFSMLK
ncbi:MAG: hypothetical protein K2H64_05370 [Desulfovibrio sp.]|nr:hypothetical protein [Desulfovibrio sp.]